MPRSRRADRKANGRDGAAWRALRWLGLEILLFGSLGIIVYGVWRKDPDCGMILGGMIGVAAFVAIVAARAKARSQRNGEHDNDAT